MTGLRREDIARLSATERAALLQALVDLVNANELRLGDAARFLRSRVLGVDRAKFAEMIDVSERALRQLETDPEANPTLSTLTRVFRLFGGRVGLVFGSLQPQELPSADVLRWREAITATLAVSPRAARRASAKR